VIDAAGQWLAETPLKAAPSSDPAGLEVELGALANFFEFRRLVIAPLAATLGAWQCCEHANSVSGIAGHE
jgi:hypothetical protein